MGALGGVGEGDRRWNSGGGGSGGRAQRSFTCSLPLTSCCGWVEGTGGRREEAELRRASLLARFLKGHKPALV